MNVTKYVVLPDDYDIDMMLFDFRDDAAGVAESLEEAKKWVREEEEYTLDVYEIIIRKM